MDAQHVMQLRQPERLLETEAQCRRELERNPGNADAWEMLGVLASRRGAIHEAVAAMTRAVDLAPAMPEFRINLSAALGAVGRPADAIPHLAAAMWTGGSRPELHNNLGITLEKLKRLPEALAAYKNAIGLRPQYVAAHYNRGQALRKLGRTCEAMDAYRQVLRLRPGHLRAANTLAGLAAEIADVDQAIACFRGLLERNPDYAPARSAMLYSLHYDDRYDAEAIAREHREWGRRHCDPLRTRIAAHTNTRDPDRRLRVGYVSPDLREHTVTKFVTAPIQYHEPEHFEIFCYSDVEKPDHVTDRLKGAAEQWRETRKLNDAQLDELIRKDQIDILVDLRGHAADNRLTLFARKPAPVQINMVGYFNTTGLSAMDYRLTDQHMDPSGKTEHLNTEKLIRIEPSCWCYTPEPGAPDVVESPVLKNGYVTFGSLNKIVKVSEPCARLWAGVLEAVPNSRLLLSVAGDAARVVRERLGSMGLPVDRLVILDKARGTKEYLERFGRIDIALDTFPFNGITTTCDGLWMGVPCVSLAGATESVPARRDSPSLSGSGVSRAGKSILHAANLPELCADTSEQFVRIATELARDLGRLCNLRRGMRDRLLASPLMDRRGFARNLETAYRRAWWEWCEEAQ